MYLAFDFWHLYKKNNGRLSRPTFYQVIRQIADEMSTNKLEINFFKSVDAIAFDNVIINKHDSLDLVSTTNKL